MTVTKWSPVLRYGFALITVAITSLVATWLKPDNYATFLIFIPAPLLSLWVGGMGPACLAAIASAVVADYLFLPPIFKLNYLVADIFFFVVFGLSAWLFDSYRKWAASEIERQRELLDASVDPIYIRDKANRVIFWNNGAERLYQWSKEEALGRNSFELLQTQLPKPLEEVRQEFYTRGHWSGETVHTKKDGSKVEVASYWTLKRGRHGEIDSSLIVNYDLTERKRLQRNLRVTEERLAAIISSASDAIITLDRNQRIVMFNAAAEVMFGCPASKTIGQSSETLVPEDAREQVRTRLREVTSAEAAELPKSEIIAMTGLRATGEKFPFEATISRNESGDETLLTIILRDITRRRQTEIALMRNEKLASLGRLSASIAHEMNNPLAAATDLLYLLELEPSLDVVAREYAHTAHMELERAVEIGRRTLGFAKSGGAVTRVSPSEILRSVLSLMDRKFRDKNVIYTEEYRSATEINGVMAELRQVFWNLLNNALDAVPENGHIRVRVSNYPRSTGRVGVRITIADDGPGIGPRALPHLFEPFFTTKESGNGLGLWAIAEILKDHGGSVRVRSRNVGTQTGAVFSVFLPGLASNANATTAA